METKTKALVLTVGLLGFAAAAGCAAQLEEQLDRIEVGVLLPGRARHMIEVLGRPDSTPFFPLNARVRQPGGIAARGTFVAAEECVACHEDHYKEWSQSMHARAWTDPFYRALLSKVTEEGGPTFKRACTGCHTPAGVLEGEVPRTLDDSKLTNAAREGVTCHACHSVDSLRGAAHDEALSFDPGDETSGRTMRGPYVSDTHDYHDAAQSPLHESSQLCAACHDAFHPVYRFRIETPYREWQASPYGKAGIQCQDCHMSADGGLAGSRLEHPPLVPGPIAEGGPDRPTRHHHGFTGANTTLLALAAPGGTASKKRGAAYKNHLELSQALLSNAARLETRVTPDELVPGEEAEVVVLVENHGAGHNLPTGVDMVRELWLSITATDARGEVLLRSGALDQAHRLDPGALRFGRTFVDAQGGTTIEPWRARAIRSDTTIPPKAKATARYRFTVPEGARGPIHLAVSLRMRVAPQELFDRYMGARTLELPITDLVTDERELGIRGETPPAPERPGTLNLMDRSGEKPAGER